MELSNISIAVPVLRPALFLNLDGTVRRTKSGQPFATHPEDMELMPGMEKLMWIYRNMGFLILGVSNQGGIAHGYKKQSDAEKEIDYMVSLFKSNPFHGVKFCQHDARGTVEPFNHRSLLRKPDIGLLVMHEHDAFGHGFMIDYDKSLMVGDRDEDAECAKRAGIAYEHVDHFLNTPRTFTLEDGRKGITEPVKFDLAYFDNLDKCVDYFLPRFIGMHEIPQFKEGEDKFASFCHSQLSGGVGMHIRNEMRLWEKDSKMHQYFWKEYGLEEADGMSDLIIRAVYKRMKNTQPDI